jgi:hypothetical protein
MTSSADSAVRRRSTEAWSRSNTYALKSANAPEKSSPGRTNAGTTSCASAAVPASASTSCNAKQILSAGLLDWRTQFIEHVSSPSTDPATPSPGSPRQTQLFAANSCRLALLSRRRAAWYRSHCGHTSPTPVASFPPDTNELFAANSFRAARARGPGVSSGEVW